MEIEKKAIRMGAVAAGVSSIESLVKANAVDLDVLPSAKTVLAIACGQSRAALDSKNLQVKQYDTIATYEKVRKVCKEMAMALESQGYEAMAIPAYIPLDMSDGKYGMVGSMDLRRTAVEAGIGSYGKSGLVLVKGFGPRVRLGAVLTSAPLKPTKKKSKSLCPLECQICFWVVQAKPSWEEAKLTNGPVDG